LPAAYLSQNPTQPFPSKDGRVLRTIGEAVTYMLALPRVRGELCQRWQQATQLILDQADVAAVSHQMHLALFYDAQLEPHQEEETAGCARAGIIHGASSSVSAETGSSAGAWYELTDDEWAAIKPFLPTSRAACRV
jgi:hypothetical protein